MITNDHELAQISARASADLQDIQIYLGQRVAESGKVRFPRGFIRPVADFERSVWFVSQKRDLRRNVCYTLQSTDVYRWLLTRTTLTGLARELVIKHLIVQCVSVIEALLHDALDGEIGRHAKFKTRTARLEKDEAISAHLRAELEWTWSVRDAVHLFLVDGAEIGRYTLVDSNRAIRAMHGLISSLATRAAEDAPF